MRLITVLTTLGAIASIASARLQNEKRGVYETTYTDGYGSPTMAPYGDMAPAPASSSMSGYPAGQTQYVMVGGSAGLVYTPEYVSANIGDVIIFQFGVKNHTLTQSTFPLPCVEMAGGMNSF
jgi:hypothetical protein